MNLIVIVIQIVLQIAIIGFSHLPLLPPHPLPHKITSIYYFYNLINYSLVNITVGSGAVNCGSNQNLVAYRIQKSFRAKHVDYISEYIHFDGNQCLHFAGIIKWCIQHSNVLKSVSQRISMLTLSRAVFRLCSFFSLFFFLLYIQVCCLVPRIVFTIER